MKRIVTFAAAALVSLPLVAGAQQSSSGVTPPDQPRSNLEKQQTQDKGEATKYGTKSSTDQSSSSPSSTSSMSNSNTGSKDKTSMSNPSANRKGTGTDSSKSGMSNPTNTVDPTTTK